MNLVEEAENSNFEYKKLTEEIVHDAIKEIRNKSLGPTEMTIIKISCSQMHLDYLRDLGFSETYLELLVVNYNELN